MLRQAATVLAVATWACGGSPPMPVPVSGEFTDMSALAGEWSGEYSSAETGRSGSILFRLTAGTDSATGDVVMHAMTGGPRGNDPSQPGAAPTPPQVLSIRFVHIQGGRVSGKLDPYIEPTCNCQLVTVFEGRLNGTKLEGP